MFCDLHTHSRYSDGRNTLRDNVRAAEASGLDLIAVTDHLYTADPSQAVWMEEMKEQVHALQGQHSVRILTGVEATVLHSRGEISIDERIAEELDLVLVDFSGRTEGVAKAAPDSNHQLIDNVTSALLAVAAHPVVDVVAHPFNLGRLTGNRLYLTDIPADIYKEIAVAFARYHVCFDVINMMCHWFPDHSVAQITNDYANIIRIFAAQGVRFVLSSDAHAAGAIGQIKWAQRVVALAQVPQMQILGQSDVDFVFKNGLSIKAG